MKRIRLIILLLPLIFCLNGREAKSQDFALKTNLLYDATATINAGIEFGLAPRWTMNIPVNFNAWSFPKQDYIYKLAFVQPEVRYWFCDRMAGHFIGIHAHGGAYNFGNLPNQQKFLWNDFSGLTDTRYQGYFVGGGLAYGYAWAVSEHLNLEFELGFGYAYTKYDRFECEECGRRIEDQVPAHYVGPTKLGINFVYVF